MTGLSVEKLAAPTDYDPSSFNETDIDLVKLPSPTEVSCAITITMGLILVSWKCFLNF